MNRTTTLGRFVARFYNGRIAVYNTVRAGYALGPKGTRAVVVRFVARFVGTKPAPPQIRHLVFPQPALTARKGGPAGGRERAPLRGAPLTHRAPGHSVHRRVADRLALAVWQRLTTGKNNPRLRSLLMLRAARAANTPRP